MSETPAVNNFIRNLLAADQVAGKHAGAVVTRFPPEPNGYLHLGHAKSICLNFGLAREFGGQCHLRFDDTNPAREDQEFVTAIQDDVRWLGFSWDQLRHASDYFEVFYLCAERLIELGKAFVCDLSADEVRAYRGSLSEGGKNSPFRDRSPSENLSLFRAMRAGEFADGAKTLRAKIDMSSGNINLRDPALYRIRKVSHQNTGDAWCIYPMYDYAHCISDAVEGITHSVCTLEFEDHRPLYDWVLATLQLPEHAELSEPLRAAGYQQTVRTPQQIEFARGNINFTVMSKRKLNELVTQQLVDGWDDPRMPTLSGARRRGYPPGAIRTFWERAGVTKQNSVLGFEVLEGCVREELDARALRKMAVLRPLKLVLLNYPEGEQESFQLANHPQQPELGTRSVPLSRELWIEQEDFAEIPPKGFHRLIPGGEVRLRGAFIVKCEAVIKDADGALRELHCTFDASSRTGQPGSERKVKGTIHWVSAQYALPAEVRLYDRLFSVADPDSDGDYRSHLNPDSKIVLEQAWLEDSLRNTPVASAAVQFERLGYFVPDQRDHRPDSPVFNRVVTLRDAWTARK